MIVTYDRSLKNIAATTWRQLIGYLVYAMIIILLYKMAGLHFIAISATPVTILGTAVALLLTFRTNSSYDRWWEARKLWGSMVNTSRTFGVKVMTLINPPTADTPEEEKGVQKQILLRHVAYINAVRFQLRGQRDQLHAIQPFLSEADWDRVKDAANPATQLNLLQGAELQKLAMNNRLSEYNRVALQDSLAGFFDQQGASERIKNTPFPPLYDFCTRLAFWVFLGVLPIALVDDLGYKTLAFYWGVAIVFIEVLRIGFIMQNPFHNHPNDTPLTAICRTIEIDLLQMLGEREIPPPFAAKDGVLM